MSLTLAGSGQITGFDPVASGFGGLVAVKHVLKTDTFSASVGSGANVAVDDLTITHEVADPANRLIITAFFGAASESTNVAQIGLAVHDGSGLIAVGATAGSRTSVTAGGRTMGASESNAVGTRSITFVHTPGSGSKTYTVRVINTAAGTETVYINRSSSDSNNVFAVRAASALVIQEVAV